MPFVMEYFVEPEEAFTRDEIEQASALRGGVR